MSDEAVITDVAAPVEAAAPVETPVLETPAVETTETPVETDAFAQIDAALAAELGTEAELTPETPSIPSEFAPAFEISPFVKDSNSLQQAVRAADEVWKVAAGQSPASSLLEGMRSANPQGFQAVIDNLVPYIEQVTGQKFGAQPNEPVDPREARLQAIEQRFQQEEQQRQQAAYQQQVSKASVVANEAVKKALAGTFAEGQESYFLQQSAAKVGVSEQEMVNLLLQGKSDKLVSAVKAVQKDEISRLKVYNANLVKKAKALQNGVPATKGSPAAAKQDFDAYLPGESAMAYATRQFNKGK